ncbi:hypothetical protein BGX34_006200 [Mortierella sp. NVP85]|nr:hypothetical protein BGX34_006200 [Mortierella sp. NVP85]
MTLERSQDLAQGTSAIEAPAQEQASSSPLESQESASTSSPLKVQEITTTSSSQETQEIAATPAFLDGPFKIPVRSLSEQPLRGEIDELGLPVMFHGPFERTLPELINAERWDLLDDDQSDDELQSSFGALQPKETSSTDTSNQRGDICSRVSPLAPFIPGASLPKESKQTDAPKESGSEVVLPGQKEIEEVREMVTSNLESLGDYISHFVSAKLGETDDQPGGGKETTGSQEKDHQSPDSDLAVNALKGLAAVAAGGLLAKVLIDKNDSDDESNSGNRTDSAAKQSKQPPPQQKSSYLYTSATDAHSSSDDGLTFDEGAGVGKGFTPRTKTPLRHEYRPSEDTESEPSSPRFTAAQKGKQVDRAQFPSSAHGILQDDDLPPITSLTDAGFGMLRTTSLPIPTSPLSSRTDEQRTEIYPAAPPGPWTSHPPATRPPLRRSPTSTARAETTSTLSKDEQNLAFMSSARKQAPPPKPALGEPKSLLTDFPDEPAKPPSAPSQPVVTLPSDPSKAPVLRGQYELPAIKSIDQWKSKNGLAPNTFRRLVFNVGALILSSIIMRGQLYRSIVKPVLSFFSPSIAYWSEWAITLLFIFNIAEVLHSYKTNSNNFEHLPLTPSQRTLLGLDPIVTKVPGEVPIFKKPSIASHSLTERPIMSTYISPSQGPFASSKGAFQKSAVGISGSEYKDAATILTKSMSRSFNQPTVQDKADLERLMRNLEAREELQAEWKGVEGDHTKRQFNLHGGLGAPQGGLQTEMSADNATRPDLLASLNARGPITRYQPALRTTLSKDHTSKADLQKDGLYVVGHSKVLKNLKISDQQLDRWVFNMRKWLWNVIVKNVCTEMDIVDAEFAKQGLAYLDCKSATMFYTSVPLPQGANGTTTSTTTAAPAPAAAPANSLAWGAASLAASRGPSAFSINQQPQQPQLPASLQDLDARYGQVQVVKQRMVLEAYLAIPGYANRKYVIERLKAMGPFLTNFIWDSNGVAWDGGKKSWTADLPTDAQIVMHMFTVFLDLAMPSHPSQAYDRFLFSHKHYVPMESKPDSTTSLQIKQTSKNPPDYSLVVEGSMWEVVPKRLNLWYTLVLFVYMVMKENGGYIGELNIGTQMIGLGDIVEGYDM